MTESKQQSGIKILDEIANACSGKILEVGGPLSDGSGFATMSFPLKPTHWIFQKENTEAGPTNVPPMVFRVGADDQVSVLIQRDSNDTTFGMDPLIRMRRHDFAERIRAAGMYAVRASTMNGQDMDFDPDALLQNLVVGMLGYWTGDGFSGDEWANPKKPWEPPIKVQSPDDAVQMRQSPMLENKEK